LIYVFSIPTISRFTPASRIWRRAPEIIMMSAHGSADIAQEARAHGVYEFVNKPFELSTMITLVDKPSRVAG
jgi:DNA-binding NtrC family response regulator